MQERDTPAAVPGDDREDIRLAVVLNGGVSLAVWMGGVTAEINRLAASSPGGPADPGGPDPGGPADPGGSADPGGRPEVYRELLEAVEATVRVDVIAGSSAGGVNGAALAYAQVYRADLRRLGRLWAGTGSLAELLRVPFAPPAPSLLRGDGHLLPELAGAFDRLVPASLRPDRYVPPADRPLDLMITATLMEGEQETFCDDFGNGITETDSAAVFRFTRDAGTPPEEDPFHFAHDAARRLALAARCTASFPVAFEPGFAPVGAEGPDDLHPDLGGSGRRPAVASFAPSRHVLDGAILRNRPVEPALEAVYRQPADRQVRRLLMYVNPDPAAAVPERAADPGDPPSLRAVLETLVRLPFEQSVADELRRIQEANARVRAERARRPDLLGALDTGLAARLMPACARVRTRREAARIHAAVTRRTARRGEAEARREGTAWRGGVAWRVEEFAEALAGLTGQDVVRLVPAGLPGGSGRGRAAADWDWDWDWGLEPVEHLGRVAVDVLKRAIWLAPPSGRGLRARLRGHRRELHAALAELERARRAEEAFWAGRAGLLPAPPTGPSLRRRVLRDWLAGALARTAPDGGPSEAAEAGGG
ncbi:patatin-like protein, partial [Planomonospora corallina]